MVKDRLVIDEDRRGRGRGRFRIRWLLAEEQDFGVTLGQSARDGNGKPPTDRDEWKNWAAHKACLDAKAPRDSGGFYWESEKDARSMLAIIKTTLAQDRPLPEWAQTALAQGWKPPKGWKA